MLSSAQSEQLAKEVALRFDIGQQQMPALMEFLRESTEEFHPGREIQSAAKQQIGIRTKLEAVANARQRLAETLDSLSSLDRDRLWHRLWEDANRPPNAIGYADIFWTGPYPDETAFRETLEALGKRIETRLVELRAVRDKGGQPERTGLNVWTARARDFWRETLGREFTYQYVAGVHKSDAFDFCFFVLQRIAPEISAKALATAMRAMIKPMNLTVRIQPPPASS